MGNKDKKEAVIIAGANGSGKTTFARKFLELTQYEFLNADEIAKQLNPEDPLKARIAAGKKVINSIDELIKAGKSFVIESTLAGSFLEKHITKLKERGYEIKLIFLYLGSTELCMNRIKSRVMQGGHDVPDEDVIRRFNRGLVKFWDQYSWMVDNFSLYYNNEIYDFKLVGKGQKNQFEVVNEPLFEEFILKVEELRNER
ncbi:MAG: AAA family ATPase [Candidatus Melainabacteria bacterium]|nr:AAA family ATPase [Candidatus Melainabacteria bacterium]